MKNILLISTLIVTCIVPGTLVYAQTPAPQGTVPELTYSVFVRCDGVTKSDEPQRQKECNLVMLMQTVVDIVSWLFYISIPIATALFAYAGLLYMTGVSKNISSAKSIFTSVAIGFIIMCTGWIAVKTFVGYIVSKDHPYATMFLE